MSTTIELPNRTLAPLPIVDPTADPTLRADAEHLSDALSELIRVTQFRDRDRACCYDISVSQCHALKGVVDASGNVYVADPFNHRVMVFRRPQLP